MSQLKPHEILEADWQAMPTTGAIVPAQQSAPIQRVTPTDVWEIAPAHVQTTEFWEALKRCNANHLREAYQQFSLTYAPVSNHYETHETHYHQQAQPQQWQQPQIIVVDSGAGYGGWEPPRQDIHIDFQPHIEVNVDPTMYGGSAHGYGGNAWSSSYSRSESDGECGRSWLAVVFVILATVLLVSAAAGE